MPKHFFYKALVITLLSAVGVFALLLIAPALELNINTVTTQKDTLFQVSDSASVFAAPDTAMVQISVVREGETVAQVQQDLNKANNAVIDAIKKVGIEEGDIKTTRFGINPEYDYNRETGESNIVGYRANSSLEVRTTDFDLINQVIDDSTQAGANQVGQVNFIVDDRDQYLAQARAEAIEGAKQKAKEISKEAGLNLGSIVDVQVFEGGSVYPIQSRGVMYDEMAEADFASTTLQPGEDEINVSVQLFYALQ